MSYSSGLLESTRTKLIEGIPGVGFKLTDMENKKITNLIPGTDDSHPLTKKQIYNHVKVNGGSCSQPVDLSNYLKKDGSDQITGLLDMNNRRIQNVGPGRHNTTDALTHLQLEAFYFDLNVDDGKIEAQNPIDMGNKKITGLKEPIHHKDAAELNNNILKSGLTNNLDIKNNKIVNLKTATSGNDAVNFTQLNNELSNYLHLTGGISLNLSEITFHKNIHVELKFIFQIFVMTMNLIVQICHFKGKI